jgi:alpha-glucosidase
MMLVASAISFAKEFKLSSPDGKILLTVSVGPDIRWSAAYDGKEAISSVNAGMVLDNGKILGQNESVKKVTPGKISQVLEPVVAYKRSKTEDNGNTLVISFRSGLSIQFRAYNDGVAYRFETSMKDDLVIKNEIADLQFPSGSYAWYPLEESFMSHNERIQ